MRCWAAESAVRQWEVNCVSQIVDHQWWIHGPPPNEGSHKGVINVTDRNWCADIAKVEVSSLILQLYMLSKEVQDRWLKVGG